MFYQKNKMKNLILTAALLLSLTAEINAQNKTKINISLSGLKDSTEIQLKLPYKNSHHRASEIERGYLINGKVSFDIELEESKVFHIGVRRNYGVIRFMASAGDVVIVSADTKINTDYGDGSVLYSYDNCKVTGAAINNDYQNFTNLNLSVWKKYEPLLEVYKDMTKTLYEAEDNDDTKTVKEIKATSRYKEYSELYDKYIEENDMMRSELMDKNMTSWWGPLMALEMYYDLPELDFYNKFPDEIKNTYYGKRMLEFMPVVQTGKPIPSFCMLDTDKKEKEIYSFLKDKKCVIVDFWASWCGPCKKEIPNLKRIYENYAEKGLEIISISIDRRESDWEKALVSEKLTWPNFLDYEQKISDQFKVRAVPEIYILDENGNLLAKNLRGEELEEAVKKQLNK